MQNPQEEVKKIHGAAQVDISWPARSATLGNLFGALAKAQAEFKVAIKNKSVSYKTKDGRWTEYDYADLEAIVAAALPSLNKYQLSVSQEIVRDGNNNYICITCLGHDSGEYKESRIIIPTHQDIKQFGSNITYVRRYGFAGLVGVTAQHEDNDATEVVPDEGEPAAIELEEEKSTGPVPTITREQYEMIIGALNNNRELGKEICESLGINSIKYIPKARFQKVLDYIYANNK